MLADMRKWPWAQPAWQRTVADLDALHHAVLLTGVEGVAKREFAIALSHLLLCRTPTEAQQPCGQCQSCTLFMAGTHPDFHVLTTELEWRDGRIDLVAAYCNRYQEVTAREKRTNPSRVIPVDHVRLLIERFYSHAHIATRKVALILPADRMNVNAANALLKLLEEPPSNSIFILVSAVPGYLPATIRSRCIQIGIALPDAQVATTWLCEHMPVAAAKQALALSNGGPIAARKMFDDKFLSLQQQFLQGIAELSTGKIGAVELAERFKQHDFLQWLDWLHRFSCELIKWGCGATKPQWCGEIGVDAAHLSIEKMFTLYDKVSSYRKIAREQFNQQLAMEEIILTLQHAVKH